MKITLETITPICIRSGEKASALGDYIYDPNRRVLHLIDHGKLENWLEDQGNNARNLLKELILLASSQRGTLSDFFQQHHLTPTAFSKATIPLAFPTNISFQNRTLFLPTLTGGKPYIPGSSLKGAIRTALMFQYIRTIDHGKPGFGASLHLKGYRNMYTGDDIFRLNTTRRSEDQPRLLPENDALRFLQVSDTKTVPLESLRVYSLERVGASRASIPVLLLGLNTRLQMNSQINILPGFENALIPDYWKEFFAKGEKSILQAVWEYSRLLLKDEIDRLEKRNTVPANNELYKDYTQILIHTKNEIKQGAALLRIGFGKTYFFNSIGYYLSEEEKKHYKINIFREKYIEQFPSTRWVIRNIENRLLPLGWCLIIQERDKRG